MPQSRKRERAGLHCTSLRGREVAEDVAAGTLHGAVEVLDGDDDVKQKRVGQQRQRGGDGQWRRQDPTPPVQRGEPPQHEAAVRAVPSRHPAADDNSAIT